MNPIDFNRQRLILFASIFFWILTFSHYPAHLNRSKLAEAVRVLFNLMSVYKITMSFNIFKEFMCVPYFSFPHSNKKKGLRVKTKAY